jgi:drug/metabolite transporter (DMT)-like permease
VPAAKPDPSSTSNSQGTAQPRLLIGISRLQALGLMALATLMWSIAGVVTRHLEQAQSFEVIFWRSFFTALSLLVLLPATQGRGIWAGMRQSGSALWWSGICWAAMFTSFMAAILRMPVANVLVTMAVGPLLTALAARIFIGHRIAVRTWVAIAVAGSGMVWMYGAEASTFSLTSTLVALCVPLSAALNWTVVQNAQRLGHAVNLLPAILLGAVLSALCTLPFALPWQASASDIALLALLGLVQLAIPCMLVVYCGRVLHAPEIALLALLEVLFGIALAWWGAGEQPQASVLWGGTLVIAALVLNELWALRQKI